MKKKIKASLPQLTLDSEKDFYKSIINKKLLIFNYNGTSFLEALSLKIPTLLLFDKNIWHIKNNEIQYFNLLKNVGILHDNPNDITKFINNNLNDLDKWWNGLELQSNVNLFCKNYINYDNNLENKII
jgi:putative transferase (TIGR04331 family)